MSSQESIHPLAWTAWLAATVIALSITRNPLYLGLILLWLALVLAAVRLMSHTKSDRAPLSPQRFALLVIPLSAIFNALNVHIGTNVLFTLPLELPLVGGPITLEALVYGALNGLVLTGLVTGFLVLNCALSVRSLIGLIPRVYYPVAIVVLIAMTFVPVTLQHFQRIREAQAIRGHRIRGVRSWLPLFLPLLMGGMERALQLAEAMTARGFASTQASYGSIARIALVIGLLSVGSGIVARSVWGMLSLGLALIMIGSGMIVGILWHIGRQQHYTTYGRAHFRVHDWLIGATALLVATAFLPTGGLINRSSLFYYPYPTLMIPEFHIGIGLATWGMLTPGIVLITKAMQSSSGERP